MFHFEKIAQEVINGTQDYTNNVIVCLETAAEFIGLSNGGLYIEYYQVYSDVPIDTLNIQSIILDKKSLDSKETLVYQGIKCTTPEQTIRDMLDIHHDVDIQTLLESLSNYYYEHKESFASLESSLTDNQKETLSIYREDAILYYNED